MDTRPEPTPEGKLIDDAAALADISIREAARRAGISYGRWRQIAKGFQNISPGVFAPVRDAPAKTIAKMAGAVGVTPTQLIDAGRPDAAAILAKLKHPEPDAPELPREPVADDDMTRNIMVAAGRPEARRIWAGIRERLETTPAGAELLADPAQSALWPPESGGGRWGGAPVELSPQAVKVLDSTPADILCPDPIDNAAARMVKYSWPDRVGMAAAMRGRLGRPTSAVRRAG